MLVEWQAKTTEMLEKQNQLLQSIVAWQTKQEEPVVFAPKKINDMSYKVVFKVLQIVRDYEHGTVSYEQPDWQSFVKQEDAQQYGVKKYGIWNFDILQEKHPYSING